MNAKRGARLLAVGRVAIGAALVLVPARAAAGWVGPERAAAPAMQAILRSLGVRDVVLGLIALHTLENPDVGPRWQRTCAVVDAVDAAATLAAARDLPARGVALTGAVAGGAAVAGFAFARRL